ncbi:universal stress protein [soil metagenome]
MNTYLEPHPIVVGVEDDEPASLRYAIAEAERLGCGVRVVHVFEVTGNPGAAEPAEWVSACRESASSVLDRARKLVDYLDSDVPVEYVLYDGRTEDVLVQLSAKARMIVLGPDDASWRELLFKGHISRRLAQEAWCPVVVVPPDWDADQKGSVIVTLDNTTTAYGPLRFAFDTANHRHSPLRALNVTPVAASSRASELRRQSIDDLLGDWAEDYPQVPVWTEIQVGEVAERVKAAIRDAVLVVVGRPHHHSVLASGWASEADNLITEPLCPVAVVPSTYSGRPVRN